MAVSFGVERLSGGRAPIRQSADAGVPLTFHVKQPKPAHILFHVKRADSSDQSVPRHQFHVKRLGPRETDGLGKVTAVRPRTQNRSLQWVDHEATEQLGVKVRALGRHPIALEANRANVVHGGGQDKSRHGILAGAQALNDLVDLVDVLGRRLPILAKDRLDDEPMQHAHP